MNNEIINEIIKVVENHAGRSEVIDISDVEYRINSRLRDLRFTLILDLDRFHYRVQCSTINDFMFIAAEEIYLMISSFKELQYICEEIEIIFKKYK